MTNNTATLPVNNANVMSATLLTPEQANALLNYIMSGKAIVIVPDANTFNFPSVVSASVETKPKRVVDMNKYYSNKLNRILAENGISYKCGQGAKRGTIRRKTYNYLLNKMKEEHTAIKAKKTFSILVQAGMLEEGRGLKYDIVVDVYNRLPKQGKHCFTSDRYMNIKEEKIIAALKDLPLTNDFPRKMDKFMNDKLNDVVEVTAIG